MTITIKQWKKLSIKEKLSYTYDLGNEFHKGTFANGVAVSKEFKKIIQYEGK